MPKKYMIRLFQQCTNSPVPHSKSFYTFNEVIQSNRKQIYGHQNPVLSEAGSTCKHFAGLQFGTVCDGTNVIRFGVTYESVSDNTDASSGQVSYRVMETSNAVDFKNTSFPHKSYICRNCLHQHCSIDNNTPCLLSCLQTDDVKDPSHMILSIFKLDSLVRRRRLKNLTMTLSASHILGHQGPARALFSKKSSELILLSRFLSTDASNSQTVSAAKTEASKLMSNHNKMEFYRRQLPETCTSFCSEEGKKIFAEALSSGHMDSYFQLASQFMTQDEPAYCGLSTLVMVLNALEIDPNRVWKAPWRWYDERMLDCCVPLSIVQKLGVTMDQLACLAACNNLHVNLHRADSSNAAAVAEFRNIVILATQRTDIVVVAAYSRQALKQTGDGHFACIGGYNPNRDLVLIMDTARFKYPPHWVPVSLLCTAMQAADSNTGLPRGYLVLSKSKMPKALLFHLTSDISPISIGQIVADDSNVKTSLDYLLAFADSWEAWLGSKPTSEEAEVLKESGLGSKPTNGKSGVLEEAVQEMVRLLKGRKLPLCTSMMRGKRTPEEWRRHQKDVVDLIDSLEQLNLFKLTHNSCVASLYECDDKKNFCSDANVSGIVSPVTNTMSCCKAMDDEDLNIGVSKHVNRVLKLGSSKESKSELSKEAQSISVPLSRSHYAAMLLLSWPYHRCTSSRSGRSRGHILMEEVQALLSTGSNTVLLERESNRLRQQLASILIYLRSTNNSKNK